METTGPLGFGPLSKRTEGSGPTTSSLEIHHHRALCCHRPSGRTPLLRHAEKRPLPYDRIVFRGKGSLPLPTFHPRGFAPSRWFPPLCRLQIYCTLLPDMRFVVFPMAGRPVCRNILGLPRSFPRRIRTLRRIPLFPSRTASPRPLPACRFDDYQVLLREKVRNETTTLPPRIILSFRGFFPLQGPPSQAQQVSNEVPIGEDGWLRFGIHTR